MGALAASADTVPQELPSDSDKLAIRVGHEFSIQTAHERLQMLLDYWSKAFGVKSLWDGQKAWISGRVMGVTVRAWLEIRDGGIGGEAVDPGPLFRGIARDYVTKKLRKYMHPQYQEP